MIQDSWGIWGVSFYIEWTGKIFLEKGNDRCWVIWYLCLHVRGQRESYREFYAEELMESDLGFENCLDFPGGSAVKNLPAMQETQGSTPGSGRSPEEGNGNPLQFSCQDNPMDRGAWWSTVHRVTKESGTTYQLNNNNWLLWSWCIMKTRTETGVSGGQLRSKTWWLGLERRQWREREEMMLSDCRWIEYCGRGVLVFWLINLLGGGRRHWDGRLGEEQT